MPTQAQQAKADAEERASFPYRGPRVDAELRQTERGAVVVVQVAAPRPGYRLELQETRLGNEGPEALLTLTEPAATDDAAKESGVATAPVVQRFPVPALNPVRVLVRQVQVGVHYIVDPPHELAVIAR